MEIREYKEVTENKNVTIGYKCDSCGKVHNGIEFPDDWYIFYAFCNNQYNDFSEKYMVCSPECYVNELKNSVEDFEYMGNSKIDNFSINFTKKLLEFIKR